MQRARDAGYARSIGISNFDVGEIEALLAEADVPPAVNQIQFSPWKFRRALLEACEEHDIALEPYSSLKTADLDEPTLTEIAERHGHTPAQVILRWCVQRALPTIPKSVRRERIEENGQLFDFELSDDEMGALDGLDTTGGTTRALERKWW